MPPSIGLFLQPRSLVKPKTRPLFCGRVMYRRPVQKPFLSQIKPHTTFGSLRADAAIGTEVLRVLKPLGIDAAVKALAAQTGETSAAQRQLDLALQEAQFAAAHARRQYDAVDPANRLVAGELERRWNEALQVVHRLEGEIAELEAQKPAPLGEKEQQHLTRLGADLELAWTHPAVTAETRKRILRTA